jgi:hypothetical protein
VKRIEVDPDDVRIVSVSEQRRSFTTAPEPLQPGFGGWLRRYRLRIAGGLAIAEALLWALDFSKLWLLAIAAVAIGVHFFVTPRVDSYTLRQVTWTLAFAQALVAIGTILLLVVGTVLAIGLFVLLVGLVLAGVAALLGDRR